MAAYDPYQWYTQLTGNTDNQINQQALGYGPGTTWREVGLNWADDPKRSSNIPLSSGVYQALYDDALTEAGKHQDQVQSAGNALGAAVSAIRPGIEDSFTAFNVGAVSDPNVGSFLDSVVSQASSLDSGADASHVRAHEAAATEVLQMYSEIGGYEQTSAGQPGLMFDLWLSSLADATAGDQVDEDKNMLQIVWQFVDAAAQPNGNVPGYIFGFPNTSISNAGNVPANYNWQDLPLRFQSLSTDDQLSIARSIEPPATGVPQTDSVTLADGSVQPLSEYLTFNVYGPYDPAFQPSSTGAQAYKNANAANYQTTTEQRNWWYAGAMACAAVYNASGAGQFNPASPAYDNETNLFPGAQINGGGAVSQAGTAADCLPGGDPALCKQYCANAGATDCANCPLTSSCIATYCAGKGANDCTNCPSNKGCDGTGVSTDLIAGAAVAAMAGLAFFLYR